METGSFAAARVMFKAVTPLSVMPAVPLLRPVTVERVSVGAPADFEPFPVAFTVR